MIYLKPIGAIEQNSHMEVAGINGEILKVVVFIKKELPTVKIKVSSLDGEVLCNDYLNGLKTRFYPKNTLFISEEQTFIENYFINSPIYIDISGLGDGERIEAIAIYYK